MPNLVGAYADHYKGYHRVRASNIRGKVTSPEVLGWQFLGEIGYFGASVHRGLPDRRSRPHQHQ